MKNKILLLGLFLIFLVPFVYSEECNPRDMEMIFKSSLEETHKENLENIKTGIDETFLSYENDFIAFSNDVIIDFHGVIKGLVINLFITILGFELLIAGFFAYFRQKKEMNLLRTMDDKIQELKELIEKKGEKDVK